MAQAGTQAEAPLVLRQQDGGVVTLTLNRGERFNPLSMAMILALDSELERLAGDRSARVVVLAAAGRGFCAGHDLKEMGAHQSGGAEDRGWQQALFASCGRMMLRLTELPQPVVARVHGVATAAGCQLVSMCDLAVASDSARFALPGVNVGVFCSSPVVGVVRNVGRKRAMEMLLTGELFDAATALEWGLVNSVVPAERLDDEVRRFTDAVSSRSAEVIALGKRAFYRQADMGLEDAYALATETMTCNLMMPDSAEGIAAFVGRRAPKWGEKG